MSHASRTTRVLTAALLATAMAATAQAGNLLSSAQQPPAVTLEANASPDLSVSGTVRNASDVTVSNVEVVVHHNWLWRDEYNPGSDDPGFSETVTITEEIPAGGSHEFTYEPSRSVPQRDDGRFVTHVSVGGYQTISGG